MANIIDRAFVNASSHCWHLFSEIDGTHVPCHPHDAIICLTLTRARFVDIFRECGCTLVRVPCGPYYDMALYSLDIQVHRSCVDTQ